MLRLLLALVIAMELLTFDLALQSMALSILKAIAAAAVTALLMWGYFLASGGRE